MNNFRIQITNENTGEVITDVRTNCIIGAFEEDGLTCRMAHLACSEADIACTMLGAMKVMAEVTKEYPRTGKLVDKYINTYKKGEMNHV